MLLLASAATPLFVVVVFPLFFLVAFASSHLYNILGAMNVLALIFSGITSFIVVVVVFFKYLQMHND